jgi:hypothetical protein
MIKAFIAWLFKSELAEARKATVEEAKGLLLAAKSHAKREFVQYERYEIDSSRFLAEMLPFFDSRAVVSWINEHKINCLNLMRQCMQAENKDKVVQGMAQVLMLDTLLADLSRFHENYLTMLEQRKDSNV